MSEVPLYYKAIVRILSTKGRGVRLWWEFAKPKGPKGGTSGVVNKCTEEGDVIQGHWYLVHRKKRPSRTLQYDYA